MRLVWTLAGLVLDPLGLQLVLTQRTAERVGPDGWVIVSRVGRPRLGIAFRPN